MKLARNIIIFILITRAFPLTAQTTESDTARQASVTFGEVVISANKVEESKKTVAQQVQAFSARQIETSQSQTTAEVIANTGAAFVQKSQQGGGSPVLRGFEASRILLVVDGVRLNNLIYRAGHLQDIVKTDNNSMERIEILYGPSSTMYGSDALGGVIHMYTKKPVLAAGDESAFRLNALTRHGSVSDEFTGHVDFNFGGKSLASLTSFTYSTFGDLKMGENQNPFYNGAYGERYYFAQRFGTRDSVVKNENRFVQVGSGYTQYDLIQKFLFKQNEFITHGINFQYSTSTDVPRYDRLTDNPTGGLSDTAALTRAEFYYGPQMRMLAAYDYNNRNLSRKIQNIHFGASYQMLEESRHDRNFQSNNLNHRTEKVGVIGLNFDFQRLTAQHNIRFGADAQLNTVESTAERENIVTGTVIDWDTRYFNGDNNMNNFAAYFSHTWQLNDHVVLTDGLRFGYSMLKSTIADATVFPGSLPAPLPYSEIEQNTPVWSGSVGLIHSPYDDLKLSFLVSTGFRVPNVDDMTKLFTPPGGGIIVPNKDLKPERTINYEVGIAKVFSGKSRWENFIYYTTFKDIAVLDHFQFNGEDSILYDSVMTRVYALQNRRRAYIFGFSSNFVSQFDEHFSMNIGLNYTYGRVKNDSLPDTPLDHIPPFFARLGFSYTNQKFSSDFFINYNGWKRIENYSNSGEDNPQYATPDGMPAWFTVNLRASYQIHKVIKLQAGIDNVFDIQYRTFASGINAPGRNFIVALRAKI
jgi:hemoglobin/transferrin/lactoferrin receptor protein